MICLIDLLKAYQKFIKGKTTKEDVREFILNFEQEIFRLFNDISSGKYRHGDYEHFRIFDPKLREIDKAEVRDRITHQLVFDYLEKIYDKTFYFHSYAARKGKGAHKAVESLYKIIYQNRFIKFIKHDLKIRHYARYMDDFVILGDNENNLREISRKIGEFLEKKIKH